MRTDFLTPIKLEEMEKVKLMNRIDRKYFFHIDHLQELLNSIKEDYFILKINNQSEMLYTTTYYDTEENNMFTAHHNGKLNRYKIRRRSYVSSGISFLEVKFKTNKGRTKKKRIPAEYENTIFTTQEDSFLNKCSPYHSSDLQISLMNKFTRITLVNKNFDERCTIDINLEFKFSNKEISLDDLVIVEIKSDGNSSISPLAKALRELRIKSTGFSKYCIGRTITDADLKRNSFKEKTRNIEKLLHSNTKLYNNRKI